MPKNTTSGASPPFINIAGVPEIGTGFRSNLFTLRSRFFHFLTIADNPNDPEFRRLWYVRYADDWLLGFSGPRDEAEQIKARMREFLLDELKLELSQEKTLITNARTEMEG